jgi:hypothetical protein
MQIPLIDLAAKYGYTLESYEDDGSSIVVQFVGMNMDDDEDWNRLTKQFEPELGNVMHEYEGTFRYRMSDNFAEFTFRRKHVRRS